MRTFDVTPHKDPRSLNFPVREVISGTVRPKRRMWRQGTVLDQGAEGACVGFGWTGEILASPMYPKPQPKQSAGNLYALGVYHDAQKIDEWPGESYSGTSVLAGAKTIQSRGLISGYRWAFGITDVRDAILTQGPVVIGIPWYEGMYYTLPSGRVSVSGPQVGFHCILLTGYDPSMKIDGKVREVYRWRNSWGTDYGLGGSAFVEAADLANLLKQDGEACVPQGRLTPVL